MPVLFENDVFQVSQRLLGLRWKIVHKPTGARIRPSYALSSQLGFVWRLIRGKLRGACPPGTIAEDVMFEAFAYCAINPKSETAARLCAQAPKDTALDIVREANIRAASANPYP
ncbi:hypothetical protein CDO87_03545 [Sagittula sp. P11]|uniref:hypothetical protein n=1 Tax=Sagittula sp. P11 TaxID=2009329 RepID=UPI000C2D3AE5|nr:hypothetical protein [Sagittula sp. P11]AUC52318.1 hypothetical protein CDO87_03545 [Sagittula sp. P11]